MNNSMMYVLPHLYSLPHYVIWLGGIVYGQRLNFLFLFSIAFSMFAWLLWLVAVFGWKKLTEPEVIESNKPQ
jgi:hypothetical protein